uniref:Uncharacterized protein n=1 Tax=Anopheles atroparvus TaxID=41427 RepID=A0AAG5DNX2_ANOAO
MWNRTVRKTTDSATGRNKRASRHNVQENDRSSLSRLGVYCLLESFLPLCTDMFFVVVRIAFFRSSGMSRGRAKRLRPAQATGYGVRTQNNFVMKPTEMLIFNPRFRFTPSVPPTAF